jgi:hypothetical protein
VLTTTTQHETVPFAKEAVPFGGGDPKPPPGVLALTPAMPEHLKEHSVLFHADAVFPSGLRLQFRTAGHWKLVLGMDAFELSRKIDSCGWRLFFVVPAFTASAFGMDREKVLAKALERLTQKVEARELNALEIAGVKIRPLWKIWWATVSGHPRHLKADHFLRDLDPRRSRPDIGDPEGISRTIDRITRRAE